VHPLPLFQRRDNPLQGGQLEGRDAHLSTNHPSTQENRSPAKAWEGTKSICKAITGFLALCVTSLWKAVCWVTKKSWDGGKRAWTRIKAKKEELDCWNPDENHPLVKFINESKLAGLKETVKKDRPILNRSSN
jgi:hypothetical protein